MTGIARTCSTAEQLRQQVKRHAVVAAAVALAGYGIVQLYTKLGVR
jgi:hypothetical protein